ncbi:hypothetical protein BU17DRAFT_47879 [Hysterangium stoloniferum]|nr:hypothetical protein BU17DRAFT_47879 [Hysterangium stoloniferum]
MSFSPPSDPLLSFVTATSLVHASIPSISNTLSDPDALATTTLIGVPGETASPTVPNIPPTLPTRILSPNSPNATALQAKSLITILFLPTLNWPFVNDNAQTQGQIFLLMPSIIATALNVDVSEINTYALQVQVPHGWDGGDPSKLGTIYLAFIPTGQVPVLTGMIRTPSSQLYQLSGVAGDLANQIVPSFPVQSIDLVSIPGMAPSSSSGRSSKIVRRDALIGVCSAVAIISGLVLVWWIVRHYQRRKEKKHRRLDDLADPNWGGGVYGTHNDDRRTSFFYAEDQLHAGYGAMPSRAVSPAPIPVSPTSPPPGSIGANALLGRQVPARRRSGVRGVSISAPVLQFSSIDC